MTTTKTTKTIVSNIAGEMPMTAAEKKRAAIDKWERANARAERACADRLTARDEVLAVVKHGQQVIASSGQRYLVINETRPTNAHERVVKALAAKLGLSDAQLKAEYKRHAGRRTEKAIKPV